MKMISSPSRVFGSFAIAGLIGASQAGAATSYSKDGMQTTGGYTQPASNLPMLAPGVQELGVNGYLNWETETNYALRVSYGRFITSNLMLGGQIGVDGQNSDAGYSIGAFAEYNFLTGTQWVPFIGLSLDYNRLELDDDGLNSFRAGLELGVKYFLRPNMALSLAAGGAWNSNTFPDEDDFQKQVKLGLRYYF